MYKILADENIPYAEEAFSLIGEVKLIPGRDIKNDSLKSVDILIVRSVTRVNEELLDGTPVKFVGTTTIGSDHIDQAYLKRKDIGFAGAPGCNADSVAEYIFAGLLKIAVLKKFNLSERSIGIIGYGNIGSRVVRTAQAFGMKMLINDPPLQRNAKESFFVSYDEALKADIITYHVPLNMTGMDKTYHMLSEMHLNDFDDKKIIINASRGSVVANNDLKNFLIRNRNMVILDVWENEPRIDTELLKLAFTGTPHIAGYSLEGKVNGTVMIFNALCRFLDLKKEWNPGLPEIEMNIFDYPENDTREISFNQLISYIYNIETDDKEMRKIFELAEDERGVYFDRLRKNYPVRREFSNYTVRINGKLKREIEILESLRCKIRDY